MYDRYNHSRIIIIINIFYVNFYYYPTSLFLPTLSTVIQHLFKITAFDFDVIITNVTLYPLTLSTICRRLIDWSNSVECSQIYWYRENFTLLPLESNNWLTVVTVIDRERRITGATQIYLVCFFLAQFYLYYYYFYKTHAIYELVCI